MNIRNIDRRLLTILLIVFVQMLGASLILPILPLYARREFSMSPQTITLLVSSFFAAQFLSGPTIGRLSDRYGRVPILIISQIGTVISFLMLAFAGSVEMLFAARILDGITGGNIIVAQAYITDITPKEKRTESLGYIFAAFGLGFVIGPALGGGLSALYGIIVPFLMAAVVASVVVVLTWFTLDESVSAEERLKRREQQRSSLRVQEIVRNSPLLMLLVIAFVGQFVLGMVQGTFALYGEAVLFTEYDESLTNLGVGLLLAVIGGSQFLTQTFLLRRLLARFSELSLVIAGSVLRAIAMFIFAVITTPWLGIPGSAFFAVGMGIMMPPLQSMATRTVDDEDRGAVLGVYQSSVSLSTIFSTAIAGFWFGISPTLPYWVGGGLALVVILPALLLTRHPQLTTKATVASKA